MSKRTQFTTVTPLPAGVPRQIALDLVHNHEEMIDLNPLVKERHIIPTPPHAQADELHCQWYSLTDKISYFPGVAGDVSYTCAFNDLPTGLQTHCYAPAGLTIRDKWTVGGSLPGEPTEPVELGLRVPPSGLYLREDVDMRCNVIMTGFVKKTLKKSHAALVDRLKVKAEIAIAASSFEANRNSSSSAGSSETIKPTSSGSGSGGSKSIGSLPYHLLPASAPASRPSSPASSIVSTASSPSIYSAPSSPMWSSPASSLGASPASAALSPPTAHSNDSRPQYMQQPNKSAAWPFRPSNNMTKQKPEPAPIPARISSPETSFQPHQQQPDWPLATQKAVPAPRPQSQLLIHAYQPPADHYSSSGAAAPSNMHPNSMSTTSTGNRGDDVLSPAALWQALGGGRLAAVRNAANFQANNGQQSRPRNHGRGHPDYPQVGPYDDDDDSVESNGAVAGLGVAGLRPLPLRTRP